MLTSAAQVLANTPQGLTRANQYIPILKDVQADLWPSHPYPIYLPAQVEQETCPSLKHSKCWNPRAELKTSREYGFGLAQITVTEKFNNFLEAKKWDKSLRDWQWEDRYNPEYQLKALVAYMRNINRSINGAANTYEKYAMTLSAYNGGQGGLNKDRIMCKSTRGCDNSKWFGHTELYSFRSKTAVKGYGQSFFHINREYVTNVMFVRTKNYMEHYK